MIDDWQLYATWNNVTNVQAVTSWRPFEAHSITPVLCSGCEATDIEFD